MGKKLTISIMSKGVPAGVYVLAKPNTWYPVVYFRKAKHADKKTYEACIEALRH